MTAVHESPLLWCTDLISHGIGAKIHFRCRRTNVWSSLYKFAKSRPSEFVRRPTDCLSRICRPGHGHDWPNYLDTDPDNWRDIPFNNHEIIQFGWSGIARYAGRPSDGFFRGCSRPKQYLYGSACCWTALLRPRSQPSLLALVVHERFCCNANTPL